MEFDGLSIIWRKRNSIYTMVNNRSRTPEKEMFFLNFVFNFSLETVRERERADNSNSAREVFSNQEDINSISHKMPTRVFT